MDLAQDEDSSGPSSLSSDQASLCVIPDPYDSSEEEDFIYLDKSSLPASLNASDQGRTVIVFHSVDEEYYADQSVLCQYVRPEGWKESTLDGVSLFKVGWVAASECITHVPVPQPTSTNDPIGCVIFPADTLPKDTSDLYQFCYMRDSILLGASTPFQFVSSIVDSSSVDAFGVEDVKKQSTEEHLDRSQIHDVEKVTSNLDGHDEGMLSESFHDYCRDHQFLESLHKDKIFWASKTSLPDKELNCLSSSLDSVQGVTEKALKGVAACSNENSEHNCTKRESVFVRQQSLDQLSHLERRLKDVSEEKEWFQQQYNSLLIGMKKCADDLASERSHNEDLNGHMAELIISNKMLFSENSRLNNELESMKQTSQAKFEKDDSFIEAKVAQNQTDEKNSQECKCEVYEKQLDDMTARLSAYDVLRNCLENELEEMLKAGQERDRYLVELENIKLHGLQAANNWVASTPNASANGNALLEMEENVNSTLEALECTLKEMDFLRSRKAAISQANRTLREEFMLKRKEWETEKFNQKAEFEIQINDLKKQLEYETTARLNVEKERDALKEECENLTSTKNSLNQKNTQNLLEVIETSEKKIQGLQEKYQKAQEECVLLKEKLGKLETEKINYQPQELLEDINSNLLKNLQEARDEYKKLYTEKNRIQDKLSRLQHKVRTKKNSRVQQDTVSPNTSNADPATDFMDNVCSTWRAIVDELM